MWRRTITFLLSLLSMVMAEATNHYFKHLGVSDGLSQVCIPSIYQDELGAVWLGTTEGLNRYNGKDVKVLQPSESNHGLTNNEINELCGDKNGRMSALYPVPYNNKCRLHNSPKVYLSYKTVHTHLSVANK